MPRILLIEDDLDVRLVMEYVLLDDGYEVDTTETFEGGSELLGCRDYHLVVSDGRLPDGTGMGLADKARDRGVPALIITGYPFGLRADEADDLSNYTVLKKPLRPHELSEAVKKALGAI